LSRKNLWPDEHLSNNGEAVPFHIAQRLAWESELRWIALFAGTQSGKTSWGPWWLEREIRIRGSGDYLAVTSTYDLFKLKMLPAIIEVFEGILGIGRYWAGDRLIEIKDPISGEFLAKKTTEQMYGRIILRAASSLGGLESTTAKGAWLDECGQDEFVVGAWRGVRRRLSLNLGRCLFTSTLYNLGWTKTELIDKAKKGGISEDYKVETGEVECTINKKAEICLVQFDSIINPSFPISEYTAAKESLPEDEFSMQYRGRESKLRRLIYNIFDESHKCKRFEIPLAWNRLIGIDFGGTHMAADFFAEDPVNGILYCYREYLEGSLTIEEHVQNITEGEPEYLTVVGGSRSEGQWRRDFAKEGLEISAPIISDVSVGIQRVYEALKKREIIFFDDLEGTLDQFGRYKRKMIDGVIIDEIDSKITFHFMDAIRYIISDVFDEMSWSKPAGG